MIVGPIAADAKVGHCGQIGIVRDGSRKGKD